MGSADDVVNAAKEWWCTKRPISYTREQHLDNPTINTHTDAEKELAHAVAWLVRGAEDLDVQDVLADVISHSGGIKKWDQLLGSVRQLVRSRNLPIIVNFVRASCQTDEGARQMATLMMLGLTLGSDHYHRTHG